MTLNPGEQYSGGNVIDADGREVMALDPSSSAFTTYGQNGQTGFWAPSGLGWSGGTGTGLTAQRLYMSRFVAPANLTITNIGFVLIVADSANEGIICGILDSTGTCVAQSGTVLAKINGSLTQQKVPLTSSYAVVKDTVYYACLVGPGASFTLTPQVMLASYGPNNVTGGAFGTGFPQADMLFKNTVTSLTVGVSVGAPTGTISPGLALQVLTA